MKDNEINLYMQMIENEELLMIKYFVKAKEYSKSEHVSSLLMRFIKMTKDSLRLHAKNIEWLEYYLKQAGIDRVEAVKRRNYWLSQIELELEALTPNSCIN